MSLAGAAEPALDVISSKQIQDAVLDFYDHLPGGAAIATSMRQALAQGTDVNLRRFFRSDIELKPLDETAMNAAMAQEAHAFDAICKDVGVTMPPALRLYVDHVDAAPFAARVLLTRMLRAIKEKLEQEYDRGQEATAPAPAP
jgi:hypothetical protein